MVIVLEKGEEIRDIVGYEGNYKVTNYGSVLNTKTNKLLTTHTVGCHECVSLFKYDRINSKQVKKVFPVVLLMLEAFNKPIIRSLRDVRYIDNNPGNIKLNNIRIMRPAIRV